MIPEFATWPRIAAASGARQAAERWALTLRASLGMILAACLAASRAMWLDRARSERALEGVEGGFQAPLQARSLAGVQEAATAGRAPTQYATGEFDPPCCQSGATRALSGALSRLAGRTSPAPDRSSSAAAGRCRRT